jgi:glycosyltransferase involved in cell wall biosynthesis
VIVGAGSSLFELENLVSMLGLVGKVDFPGVSEDVYSWYGRASIFVLPSLSEGFPNVLVEAMGQGLPCISFDCDAGPRDIISHGVDGFLVPVSDEMELANSILSLISDEGLRKLIGENASLRAMAYCDVKISADYLNFCRPVNLGS